MTLELNGLTVNCIIGERPEERLAPQRLRIDVSLQLEDAASRRALASDDLADTVDYAQLAAHLRDVLVAAKPQMIERAAKLALDAALGDKKVKCAKVKVTKFGAIPDLESASVTVEDSTATFPEYELAGIETIARGVCIVEGKLLLCKAKGGATSYLPGGHIEFGETGRQALVREMQEETGLAVTTGKFLGCLENTFEQHGKPHAEINLVYEMHPVEQASPPARFRPVEQASPPAPVVSRESWIEFLWCPLADLAAAKLLPAAFQRLATDPHATFEA